jgi:hypothetical protein
MPIVPLAKAEKFPAVIKKYPKANQFRKLAKRDAPGSKTYTKPALNTGNTRVLKINTATITGVRPMNAGGKKS